MKISVDDSDLYTLTDTQKLVIKNDVSSDCFEEDMKRRLQWVLQSKYESCLQRLRQEWTPKLKSRVDAIPTNDDAFAQLVFSQEDYKDRCSRDVLEKNKV